MQTLDGEYFDVNWTTNCKHRKLTSTTHVSGHACQPGVFLIGDKRRVNLPWLQHCPLKVAEVTVSQVHSLSTGRFVWTPSGGRRPAVHIAHLSRTSNGLLSVAVYDILAVSVVDLLGICPIPWVTHCRESDLHVHCSLFCGAGTDAAHSGLITTTTQSAISACHWPCVQSGCCSRSLVTFSLRSVDLPLPIGCPLAVH